MQAELSLYVNINTMALCEKPCQTSSLDEPSYWGSAVTSKGTMPPPASATTVPLLAGDRTDVHQSRVFGSRNLSRAQMWKNPPGPHVSGIGTCRLGIASTYPPLQKCTEWRKDDKKSFRIWSVSPVTDTPPVPYPATSAAVSTGTRTRCPGAAGPFSPRTALRNHPPASLLASIYAAFQSKQLLITHGFYGLYKNWTRFCLADADHWSLVCLQAGGHQEATSSK